MFTPRDYAEMHFLYGLCNGNAREAARQFRERHAHNRQDFPDHRLIIRVHHAYAEGRVPGNATRVGRPRLTDETEEQILDQIESDPSTSVRKISRSIGVPKSSIHVILKRNEMHPFHVQRVQALLPADYPKRVTFCREMLRRMQEDTDFFNRILWTDECTLKRVGIFNVRNTHCWSIENPHQVRRDHFQHQFSINLWAGIICGELIGPFRLPERVTAPIYLEFLQHELGALLEEVPLQTRSVMWLQHDGAPAHYGRQVREYLDTRYTRRWIGRGGPIQWPPRSPDLNPIDFFLWGYFKELIYNREVTSLEELSRKIDTTSEVIKNNHRALRRLKENFKRRCTLCVQAGGGNFEHLL